MNWRSAGKRSSIPLAMLFCASSIVYAGELPISGAPIPTDRPGPVANPAVDRALTTGAVPVRADYLQADKNTSGETRSLKAGLDAIAEDRMAAAKNLRNKLANGSLDRHILTWAIALKGGGDVSAREIADAAANLRGWPGQDIMRRNSEKAVFNEKLDSRIVVGAFGTTAPTTPEGARSLARALIAVGKQEEALSMLSSYWRTTKLEASDEIAILKEFGDFIPSAAHRFRMERMLYEDRASSAERVAKYAGAEALYKAWSAVIRREKNAGKLLDAVPKEQRSAGYIFARVRHLRRQEQFKQAAEVLAKAPNTEIRLVDPDEWWTERRVLSRELIDIGEVKLAYEVAANHSASGGEAIADAEFHAGWYALRALKNPRRASTHFSRIAEVTTGPISQARAYYWLGRAAEEGGPGKAKDLYARAAIHGTTFYGQLAAARIGQKKLKVTYPEPTAADRRNFENRLMVQAIRRIEAAGHQRRADLIYMTLAKELSSPGELALLAVMAENRGSHDLALRVGKLAAARGIDIGALAHPVGAIPSSAKIHGGDRVMAYAIARQESEFNAGAVSGAGALGLLQLLPGTARDMAGKTGMPYSQKRLTNDPAYNASLGTAYLGEQLTRFGGSQIMTYAGYNAGPRRVDEWVKRYGDPRGQPIEKVVDWIERIPYGETRNYVQRVVENYQVYRMRLTGGFDIVSDLTAGG